MISFLKENITFTEVVLILGGVFFFISTIYIAQGGGLIINYIAKAFYISGTIMLLLKK